MRTRDGRASGPIVERIFGDPGGIAPSVEKTWRDDFILELRLRSVSGRAIGDALMTVETHVAESGESARDAFGDPRAYARDISAATGTEEGGWAVSPTTVVGSLAGLVGMLLAVAALAGWLEDGPVAVTTGSLVGLGLLLALAGTLFFSATLRLITRHRWVVLPVPALLIGVMVGVFVLLDEPLFELPVVAVAVTGAVLLGLSVVLALREQPDDLDRVSAPGRSAPSGTLSRVAAASTFPIMTLLLLAFTWVLHAVVG